jgi:hypothetical protein
VVDVPVENKPLKLSPGSGDGPRKTSLSCSLCSTNLGNVKDQRQHVRSDWHGYNLKQRLKGFDPVSEIDFERLVGELDESISGSESSSSEEEDGSKDTTLSALLKKQAKLHQGNEDEESAPKKSKRGSGNPPLLWFSSSLLSANTSLGVYRALFTPSEQQSPDLVEILRSKQLKAVKAQPPQNTHDGVPSPGPAGPTVFLAMIGGGHFAAMIVSLTPKVGKKSNGIEEKQAIVLVHKTFHRYTTRRKQGGSQGTHDNAKGAAHSAGAGIRKYNESALEAEVRALLLEWKCMIDACELLFVRASGTGSRRTLFGPYDDQVLRSTDPRNRTFPFSTRRATQAELMRAFVELTRIKVSRVDEAAFAAAAAEEAQKERSRTAITTITKPSTPKPSKEEETALLHTSQLQALVRRSKAPALLSYLTTNTLSPDFYFHPPTGQANYHASTPLHLAASLNCPIVVLALLTKAGANPTVLNGEGKPAFDIAGDRGTRDAFRIARSELGESKWNWSAAHCPPAISKTEADERERTEKQQSAQEERNRRQQELERINESQKKVEQASKPGKALGGVEITAADRRDQESRSMTPEMRQRLERERRARAAEERMMRLAR